MLQADMITHQTLMENYNNEIKDRVREQECLAKKEDSELTFGKKKKSKKRKK